MERQIPGFAYRDGMGCYPVFACQDWSQLCADLDDLGGELVSLAIVTDPFGRYDAVSLQRCFRDVVLPFKEHFVVDLRRKIDTFVASHHRRNVHKALQTVDVEICQNPSQFLGEWISLYVTLTERHRITGISAFSIPSFAKQLEVPGIVAFRAVQKELTVGMTLWYVNGTIGYYHLGAYSDIGYTLRASFALFWYAITYFTGTGLRWLSLGAGAGIKRDNMDGLARFKRGWSTGTRPVYFCGRIFDRAQYTEVVRTKGVAATGYFPAYREGEFG